MASRASFSHSVPPSCSRGCLNLASVSLSARLPVGSDSRAAGSSEKKEREAHAARCSWSRMCSVGGGGGGGEGEAEPRRIIRLKGVWTKSRGGKCTRRRGQRCAGSASHQWCSARGEFARHLELVAPVAVVLSSFAYFHFGD